jgi:hypothetical protein
MIDLFNHSISGTSYLLLYGAVIAFIAACYWLSTRLNEIGRKQGGMATWRAARNRRQLRPVSRSVLAVNTVLPVGSKRVPAQRRESRAVELNARMSSLYIFDPATRSVSRRTFATAQDTREVWVEKHELSNRSDRSVVLRFPSRRKPRADKGVATNAQAS